MKVESEQEEIWVSLSSKAHTKQTNKMKQNMAFVSQFLVLIFPCGTQIRFEFLRKCIMVGVELGFCTARNPPVCSPRLEWALSSAFAQMFL